MTGKRFAKTTMNIPAEDQLPLNEAQPGDVQEIPLYQTLWSKYKAGKEQKIIYPKAGVLMGGFTTERHISVESGRIVCSKLVASTKYVLIL